MIIYSLIQCSDITNTEFYLNKDKAVKRLIQIHNTLLRKKRKPNPIMYNIDHKCIATFSIETDQYYIEPLEVIE